MKKQNFKKLFSIIVFSFFTITNPTIGETFITVASTTSTANSGLFDYLLPVFSLKTGISILIWETISFLIFKFVLSDLSIMQAYPINFALFYHYVEVWYQ